MKRASFLKLCASAALPLWGAGEGAFAGRDAPASSSNQTPPPDPRALSVPVWVGFASGARTRGEFFDRLERIGYAAPVSADGYMLTAAHVMEDEVCGVPFFRDRPEALLISPRITKRKTVWFDRAGKRRAESSERIGFRRLRTVRVFPGLDLALVYVRGAPAAHVENCAPPAPGAELRGALHWDRGPRDYTAAMADITHRPPGWILSGRLGCTAGDSGSAVSAGGALAGVAIEGVRTPAGIMTRVAGLPWAEIQRTIRAHRKREARWR